MTFSSKKDLLFTSIITTVCLLLVIIIGFILYTSKFIKNELLTISILSLVIIFLLWTYFYTRYELTNTHLIYKSGPIKGKIEINKIKEIIIGKTLWVGLKLATAKKGLIIKYNKYDEIYISPETNDTLINEILELNSNIKIIQYQK